jgi:hypothetical protein
MWQAHRQVAVAIDNRAEGSSHIVMACRPKASSTGMMASPSQSPGSWLRMFARWFRPVVGLSTSRASVTRSSLVRSSSQVMSPWSRQGFLMIGGQPTCNAAAYAGASPKASAVMRCSSTSCLALRMHVDSLREGARVSKSLLIQVALAGYSDQGAVGAARRRNEEQSRPNCAASSARWCRPRT